MKLTTPTCPTCGERAVGTVESIPGVCLFDGDPRNGAVEYGGGTIHWNGQITVKNDAGQSRVVCASEHQWWTEIAG